jgi:hypothetical protein
VKIKSVIFGALLGLIVGVLLLWLPMPFRSVPYWVQHWEQATCNHVASSLFPKPKPDSDAPNVFFMLMGIAHCLAWAVAGAMVVLCGAILFSKTLKK